MFSLLIWKIRTHGFPKLFPKSSQSPSLTQITQKKLKHLPLFQTYIPNFQFRNQFSIFLTIEHVSKFLQKMKTRDFIENWRQKTGDHILQLNNPLHFIHLKFQLYKQTDVLLPQYVLIYENTQCVASHLSYHMYCTNTILTENLHSVSILPICKK